MPETTASEGTAAESTAIRALLSAVEGASDIQTKGDDYNCKGLIRLFEPAKRSDAIVGGHTAKQQSILLVRSLQTCNKGQLKRFFGRVHAIVERIIEDEVYLPASVRDDDADKDTSTKEDAASAECLLFFKYVVMCIQAVVDGRILKRHQEAVEGEQERSGSGKPKTLKMPSQVFDVAMAMHDILFALHSCGDSASSTKLAVLNVCETWWHAMGERREALIVQCLPLLALRACEEEDCFTNKTHIQRLYKLRDAFHYIDFTDQSSDSLRKLVLRIASNPLCLKIGEGKKLLSSLMLDVELMKDLHLSFRAQIPTAKDSVLTAYGEIYLRAWKGAKEQSDQESDHNKEDNVQETIELEILQDLMYAVVHVASQKTFHAILTVLEPIHVDKKNKDVASMLYRLYNPILWRSLKAANPKVRQNAVELFEKVFPLNDPFPMAGQNASKEAVLKGTQALRDALKDNDPNVRAVASKAAASICAIFWEVLPPEEIRQILNSKLIRCRVSHHLEISDKHLALLLDTVIVLEHSSDKSSAAVRVASVESVTILLGNDRSHGVLRALLPSIGNLIHDKAEKVRLSVARMLVRVKTIPGIRFYHVVPVDQLLTRLNVEAENHGAPCTVVAKELTALLLNSYFPQGENVSASEQLKRTLTFLLTSPNASAVFYANVTEYLEVEAVVRLILVLSNCLKSAVATDQVCEINDMMQSKKRRHRKSSKSSDQKSDDASHNTSPPDQITADDTTLMAGLSNTIDVLWKTTLPRLEKKTNFQSKKKLDKYFSGKEFDLVSVLSHFEQKGIESEDQSERRVECFHTCSSLLNCAGRLDKSTANEVTSHVSTVLDTVQKETSQSFVPFVSSYLSFMCSVGHVADVAAAIARSVVESFGNGDDHLLSPTFEGINARRRSRRSLSKQSSIVLVPTFPPSIAWPVLDGILQGMNADTVQARDLILSSDTASSAILGAFQKGIQLTERILAVSGGSLGVVPEDVEIEWVVRACEAYGRFSLHKIISPSNKKDGDGKDDDKLGLLLKWTSKIVIPAFLADDGGSPLFQDLDISHISTTSDSIIHLPPGSPNLTSPPKQKQNRGATPENMRGHSSMFSRVQQDCPTSRRFHLASSLLVSSCLISSECLAAGVSMPGAVAEAAIGWCDIFEELDESLVDAMFPAFSRLGVQLKKLSGCTDLLERLFVVTDKYLIEEDRCFLQAKETIRSVVGRDDHETASFVSMFLKVSEQLVTVEQETVWPCDPSDSLSGLWETGGVISIFLDVFDSSGPAKRCLARSLASSLISTNDNRSPFAAFKSKCLVVLSKTLERPAIAEIMELSGLDISQWGHEIPNTTNVPLEGRA